MNAKLLAVAVALAAGLGSASAVAANSFMDIHALADETALSVNEVRMVVGARTGFAAYRISYPRVARQFKAAIGPQRYDDLMAGRVILIDGHDRVLVAVADHSAPVARP